MLGVSSNYPPPPLDEDGLYQQASGEGSASENFKVRFKRHAYQNVTLTLLLTLPCRWSCAFDRHCGANYRELACVHINALQPWSRETATSSYQRTCRCACLLVLSCWYRPYAESVYARVDACLCVGFVGG